jgi:hypothetical protein
MIMVAVIVIMIGVTVVVAGVAVTPTVMAPAVMASATGAGTTSPATCGICLADSAYAIIPGKHLGDTAEEQGRRYRGGEQALCEYSAHLATLLGLAATAPGPVPWRLSADRSVAYFPSGMITAQQYPATAVR